MYSKLFAKILDSSVWLEPAHVRLVWITLLAAKDKDGVAEISCLGNVALKARVSEEEAANAILCLESPDNRNPGQDHDGRRIERIPGVGWLVLNAKKYDDIISAEESRRLNRERVRRHRENKANCNGIVTPVMKCNDSVMQLDTPTPTSVSTSTKEQQSPSRSGLLALDGEKPDHSAEFQAAWATLPEDVPKIAKWNALRQRLFSARMKDEFFVGNWRQALKKVAVSRFLLGRNDLGWKIDVDFFLKESGFTKIMEGKYDNREKQSEISDPNFNEKGEWVGTTLRPSEVYAQTGRFDPKDSYGCAELFPEEAAEYAKKPQKPKEQKMEIPI
jgi:hypothetical protein